MSVADKLSYLEGTKASIKSAIESKGITVSSNDTFRSYSSKILSIQSGYPVPTWTTISYFHERTSTNNIQSKSFTMPTMNIPNIVNVNCRVLLTFSSEAELKVTLPSGGVYKISKNNNTPYTLSGGSQLFYYKCTSSTVRDYSEIFTVIRIE